MEERIKDSPGLPLIFIPRNLFQKAFMEKGRITAFRAAWARSDRTSHGQAVAAIGFENGGSRAGRGRVVELKRLVERNKSETILCPFPERKYEVFRLSRLCKIWIGPEDESYKLAKTYESVGNLSAKDAIHIACASYAGANLFLTCDDKLITKAQRIELQMKIMNPVDYIRQEADA